MLILFCAFSQNLYLSIEALAFYTIIFYREEIDTFVQGINPRSSHEQQAMDVTGENGIGIFNFTYYIQNMVCECKNVCDTSITGDIDTATDISFTPADNCTNQQVDECSSPPWPWIAVAVLCALLTILFLSITIALFFIVKNMYKKVKGISKGSRGDDDNGECWCNLMQLYSSSMY